MKKLVILTAAAFILLLAGCKGNKTKSENELKTKSDNELKSAISSAENIKNFSDKIFMGFRFGMSEDEVKAHFQTLLDQRKITIDSDGVFKYLFKTKNGDILTSFSTQYYNGELCEFILNFQEIDNEVFSSPSLMMHFAQDVFVEKAKAEGYDFYIGSIGGEDVYYYIKNATIVKFSSYIAPYMSYQCAPLCKMKQEEMEKEKERKVRDTALDL